MTEEDAQEIIAMMNENMCEATKLMHLKMLELSKKVQHGYVPTEQEKQTIKEVVDVAVSRFKPTH